MAYPGIFELCQEIGKKIGVAPKILKSYALCVYFQMYSASTTKYLPKACWNPAWNSLRKPGVIGVRVLLKLPSGFAHPSPEAKKRAPTIGFAQPMLESTKFSLNGDSSVLA